MTDCNLIVKLSVLFSQIRPLFHSHTIWSRLKNVNFFLALASRLIETNYNGSMVKSTASIRSYNWSAFCIALKQHHIECVCKRNKLTLSDLIKAPKFIDLRSFIIVNQPLTTLHVLFKSFNPLRELIFIFWSKLKGSWAVA